MTKNAKAMKAQNTNPATSADDRFRDLYTTLPFPNDNHRGEWRTILRTSEFQSTLQKTDVRLPVDVLMKPARVRPCRKKSHTHRSPPRCHFLNPRTNHTSVWRITEYSLTFPVLRQSIIFSRIELGTLGVFFCRSRIKRELELGVDTVE